ncbi:unnamed protein product [Hydatigera taeniaeformis]|uniref:Secreted protein n=1 Tax=Hydatigena taeniaeformis TaxID=6205 RepID=A0A0R3X4H1_HYDTA|nr:unnamed protein product [Hydatigera taeniaeformis]
MITVVTARFLSLHLHSNQRNAAEGEAWCYCTLPFVLFCAFLHLECLMRASQVNRAWNRATHHPRLFQRLCCSPEWSLPNLDAHFPPPLECRNANFFFPNLPSPSDTTTMSNVTADVATAAVVSTTSSSSSGSDSGNSIGSKNNNIGTVSSDGVDWFQKFKWRYQVRKNWARGKHRIRRFVGHTGGKWRHHSLLPISILIRCCALVIDLLIKAC